MRVAIISDYFPPVSPGGAEISALHLARALHSHVEVEVVTVDFGVSPILPFPVHYIPLSGVVSDGSASEDPRRLFEGATLPFSRPIHYMQFARGIAGLAKSRNFDLIHTQQIGSEIAAYLSRPIHRTPRVTTVRGYRHLTGRWSDDAATRHGVGDAGNRASALARLRRRLPRAAAGSSAHLFAVSDFVRRAYVDAGVASEPGSSAVFNVLPDEPIAMSDAAMANEFLADVQGPIFLFAGRLTEGKGLGMLIDAMPHVLRQIPEARLVVAGGGCSQRWQRQVAAKSIAYGVRFTGHIENGFTRALMRQSNAVVMPSLHHEPLGRVLIEAVSMGVPVVTTPYGGTPEIIEDGKNGLIVDPVESSALANALTLAVTDRSLAVSSDQFDQELRRGKLNPRRTIEKTLDVYEKVLAA